MNEQRIGSRILVTGCCGSGKSCFSRKLHERTGLPLIHLDLIWWKPDKTHISREDFDRRLTELLQGESWILDGDYSRTYEPRIRACDTVIFLDYDPRVCLDGIAHRLGKPRPDLPWTESDPDPELLSLVRNYAAVQRPRLLALLEQYPEKQRLIFRTRAEADAWLAGAVPDGDAADNRQAHTDKAPEGAGRQL